MRLKEFSCAVILLISCFGFAQNSLSGKITDADGKELSSAEVYIKGLEMYTNADINGNYFFENVSEESFTLIVFAYGYKVEEKTITINGEATFNVTLKELAEELPEVVVTAHREKIFALKQLRKVEGTAIYAGKKSEVVLLEGITGNLAANNARQIYSQVVGLNIYDNGDAGLQLNIGGRGLDPNRTSNFNTRQNGYDISADVLGYPESYYTPPAEALSEIQIVRGAASLQYGTQFGGLVNFKFKKPNPNKGFSLITRNTLGSNNLYTNYTSLSGTKDKWSYFTYFNYKKGDSFRPNSWFESKNAFANVNYQFSEKTSIRTEVTYLRYLAQQAGGLTDTMFEENIGQSNRERNWFQVDWLLYNLKFEHRFSKKTNFSLSVFGLDASRKAVGFRGDPFPSGLNENPILSEDLMDSSGAYSFNRDVLIGDFKNWGAEARLLTRYNLFKKQSAFLIGAKYYNANNAGVQGAGTKNTDADFTILDENVEDYPNVSDFKYPNNNVAVFAENIFRFSDELSVTPGVRFEHIKTESKGKYFSKNYDNANNLISIVENEDNRTFNRNFVLLGLGVTYKPKSFVEMYGNISQNYRSVTFNDIRSVSPTFIIDPEITDEKGFTIDVGLRGRYKNALSYDIGVFNVNYNDRIGNVLDDRANWVRTNIGDATIYGLESFIDYNILSFLGSNTNYKLNFISNLAYIKSEYKKSQKEGVQGNQVEFIPELNLKTTLQFGYKNLLGSIQYTYLSDQYTDSSNAAKDFSGGVREGIIGEIPAYDILDFSLSYTYKKWKLETGINNVLDNSYFTRRATGYPGPGIIPSAPRTFYTTLQFKL